LAVPRVTMPAQIRRCGSSGDGVVVGDKR